MLVGGHVVQVATHPALAAALVAAAEAAPRPAQGHRLPRTARAVTMQVRPAPPPCPPVPLPPKTLRDQCHSSQMSLAGD